MTTQWTLVGSTGRGLEDIAKMLEERWYWSNVGLHEDGAGRRYVSNSRQDRVPGMRVRQVKGRHRLERSA